jgi:hypothetical protein
MTDNDWKILAGHGVTPDNLTVAGWLDLSGTPINALPDNLIVSGWLDLSYTPINALPDNLIVSEWLDLSGTPINALPDNLTVGGWLDLRGTRIKPLYVNARNYRLDRAGDHYHAGYCRFTAAEAIAHWGASKYPDKARGAAFVAAVMAEENRRNAIKEVTL